MRRAILFLLAFIFLLGNAAAAEEKAVQPDVFWQNVQYNDLPVDFSIPLPDCRTGKSELCNPYNPYVHEQCWKAYWYASESILSWFGIEFSAGVKPPNYNDWVHWDCHYTEVWGDYFNEMYHKGGPDNPLADENYAAFWHGLRLNGEAVDPYMAPPNYDASMDYYASQRSEIGYHWYWEYYFNDLQSKCSDPKNVLEWNGDAFDVTSKPRDYCQEEPIYYYYNRLQRGYLEYWAKELMVGTISNG